MCSGYSNDGANNAFANRFEIPLNSDFHKHILQVKMVQILPIENAKKFGISFGFANINNAVRFGWPIYSQ